MPPAPPDDVAEAIAAVPDEHQPTIAALRRLIFDVAAEVGSAPLVEELKWGQPSYRSARAHESTPVRLGVTADGAHVALLVHCRSSVISDFRATFPTQFRYEGNRAILFRPDDDLQVERLRLCIEHALRYRTRASA